MLGAMMVSVALSASGADLLDLAIERFSTVDSYRVTIRSSHAEGGEEIRYFYRKPGLIRMEFVRPHAGAMLIYNPSTQRVRLWPFGAGRFPELNLSPGNLLIRSPRGQRVDHSDVGTLLNNVKALQRGGKLESHDEETLAGRPVRYIDVSGTSDFAIAGVHRYQLWLDASSLFPVEVISRDLKNAIIETVHMDDAEINTPLPDILFDP
jgi:outer membrane lipoprotein-sorting protein